LKNLSTKDLEDELNHYYLLKEKKNN